SFRTNRTTPGSRASRRSPRTDPRHGAADRRGRWAVRPEAVHHYAPATDACPVLFTLRIIYVAIPRHSAVPDSASEAARHQPGPGGPCPAQPGNTPLLRAALAALRAVPPRPDRGRLAGLRRGRAGPNRRHAGPG